MNNYKLNLKNNEEMINDVDDLMEKEHVKFMKAIKGLTEEDIVNFNNWVKVYKLLNYDIISDLKIDKIYRFNDLAIVVELTFRGNKEYDFLCLNPNDLTVSCMNIRNNSARDYISRRLLIPQTPEEALMFAKAPLDKQGVKVLNDTLKLLQTDGSRYDVTEKMNLDSGFVKIYKPKKETKQEVKNEEVKNEVIVLEPVKEDKEEHFKEVKEQHKKKAVKKVIKKVRKHKTVKEEPKKEVERIVKAERRTKNPGADAVFQAIEDGETLTIDQIKTAVLINQMNRNIRA